VCSFLDSSCVDLSNRSNYDPLSRGSTADIANRLPILVHMHCSDRYRSDVLHPCYSIVPTVVAKTTLKPLSHRCLFLRVPLNCSVVAIDCCCISCCVAVVVPYVLSYRTKRSKSEMNQVTDRISNTYI
jgi:hypothetical protein